MKKILTVCGLCVAVSGSVFPQRTDRERDGLKGPVKTVRIRQATILSENGKQSESPLLLTHVVNYDQSGNRTELALYDSSGTLTRRIVYEYDSATKRRSALITYNAQNVMVRKVVDTYWDNGLKIDSTIQTFNDDGTLFKKTQIRFNTLGELVEVTEHGGDGSLILNGNTLEATSAESVSSKVPPAEEGDRLVTFGRMRGSCLDLDLHENCTRGITASTYQTYSSGQKSTQTTWAYREFTYY